MLGACLLAAGVVLNPWFLESYVVLDGYLSRPWRVVVVEILLVLVGLRLLCRPCNGGARRAPLSARHRALRLAVALTATGSGLALAEIGIRAAVSPLVYLDGSDWHEFNWRRFQLEQVRVGNGAGGAARLQYVFDAYDPAYGWLPIAGYEDRGVRTNSLGIRADREYSPNAPPGFRRIVAIGDSYTWGEDVRNEETYSTVLERSMPRTEVINLGVHGWGTDQQYLYLKERGLALHPDLVVLGFFEDDVQRNELTFFGYAKPRFVLDGDALRLSNSPVPAPEQVLSTPFRRPWSALARLVGKVTDDLLDRTALRPMESRPVWRLTVAILDAMQRECAAAGSEFLVVHIPIVLASRPAPIERAVREWARSRGVHYLSTREVFTRLPDVEQRELYAGHWTPRGHTVAAAAIRDYIVTVGLLE
jgi:hypothetical protein